MTLVYLIAAANCVVLLLASVLAARYDGSADGVLAVLGVGGLAIVVGTGLALSQFRKGKGGAALLAALGTLPMAYLAGLALFLATTAFGLARGNSAAFVEACKGAGPRYLAQAKQPVRSVAYDWPRDSGPPGDNSWEVGRLGNRSNVSGGTGRQNHPSRIAFIETRGGRYLGHGRKLYRRANADHAPLVEIPEFTADALVFLRQAPREPGGLQVVDITVTDRRDGAELASMRYVVDGKKNRACGETSPGFLEETAFVLRAIGP